MGLFGWLSGKLGAKEREPLLAARKLVPIGEGPIKIDLSTSQVAGLIIHDPRVNVLRVLGAPTVCAPPDKEKYGSEEFLYNSRGMCVVFVADQVHAFHFWVSRAAAEQELVYHEPELSASVSQGFVPCDATIVGRGDHGLEIQDGLSEDDIQHVLGMPDSTRDWHDGVKSLTYHGKDVGGGRDRLHLELRLKLRQLRSVYITH